MIYSNFSIEISNSISNIRKTKQGNKSIKKNRKVSGEAKSTDCWRSARGEMEGKALIRVKF